MAGCEKPAREPAFLFLILSIAASLAVTAAALPLTTGAVPVMLATPVLAAVAAPVLMARRARLRFRSGA